MKGVDPSRRDASQSELVRVYLRHRANLLRFFTLRLGSLAAAEDLVQEIYLKIERVADDGEVRDAVGYLYRIGSNLMLDRLRQTRRAAGRDHAWHESEGEGAGPGSVDPGPSPERQAVSRQRLALMLRLLNELPPRCREAFSLHKLDGLSHAETAKRMGVSKSAVEKHISAALKHLLANLP